MSSESSCPAPSAHRRLMDCHDHWHAALDAYMDPHRFRMALNSLIQDLRNVTWLLQKQKSTIANFGEWYPEWQSRAKADSVMVWITKARNRIVKEADLELLSTARLTLSFDWVNEDESVWTVPPRFRPVDIARMLHDAGMPDFPDGEAALTIERRWVDRLLPDWELLDACDHAYGELVQVIRRAHEESNVPRCDLEARDRDCVTSELEYPLDCNWTGVDARSAEFDLGTLTPYVTERRATRVNLKKSEEAARQYGITEIPSGDAIDRVPVIFDHATRLLERDGFASTVAMLLRGQDLIELQSPIFQDQASKLLAMRSLATRVRLLKADGLIFVSEVWGAKAPPKEDLLSGNYVPARKRPDRTELLQVVGISHDGRILGAMAQFHRDAVGIKVDEPEITAWPQAALMSFRPVFRAWDIAEADPMAALAASIEDRERTPDL